MTLEYPRIVRIGKRRYWEFPNGRLLPVVSGGALPATDNFDDGSLGTNWSTITCFTWPLLVYATVVGGSHTGDNFNGSYWNADQPNDNQYIQLKLTNVSQCIGPTGRTSTTDCVIFTNQPTTYWEVMWYNGGAFTSLGTWTTNPANNDVAKLTINGTNCKGYVNGTERISGSNAGIPSSGYGGIWTYDNGGRADDFEVGNLETAVTKTLTDTSTGTDTKPTISASLSRSDNGVGTDAISITIAGAPSSKSLVDTGSGIDEISRLLSTLSISDLVIGTDVVSVSVLGANLIVDNPVIYDQNTTNTTDLDGDGITWAQAHPIIVDKYNKLILAERSRTNKISFVYSNNGGSTWTDGLNQNDITFQRGSLAYDSRNDILHVLWRGQAYTDGIIYRRYTISRDGSNNITAIVRDNNINLTLDYQNTGTVAYEHPVLIWLDDLVYGTYGAIIAFWAIFQTAGVQTGVEVRSSMRILSNDSNDNTAGNWTYPITDSSAVVDNDASVPYSAVYTSIFALEVYLSATRKVANTNAKDIYVCINVAGGIYFRRMQWNAASNNWSDGLSDLVSITNIQRSGTDNGYELKRQLCTEFREDYNGDFMALGIATWKDNVNGDSWGFVVIDNADNVSAITDVYVGGAANCGSTIFITGDIVVRNGYIIASYCDLPNKYNYVRCFDSAGNEAQSPMLLFDDAPTDGFIMWQNGLNTTYNNNGVRNKLLGVFRDYNAEAADNPPTYSGGPYNGYSGLLDWIISGPQSLLMIDTGLGVDSSTLAALLSIYDTASIIENITIVISGGIISGSTVWGQSTGVLETNIRTFSGNWTGTGSITGAGDEEKIALDTGQYMISEVVNTGIDTTITLLQNEYSSGDTVTLQYRHGATQAACEAASWNDYTIPFESLGYVQVRVSV